MGIRNVLEPLYKPLNRVSYTLNLVGYGLESYWLAKGHDNEIVILATMLTSFSLIGTALLDMSKRSKTLDKDKQRDVFWETFGEYNFRRG